MWHEISSTRSSSADSNGTAWSTSALFQTKVKTLQSQPQTNNQKLPRKIRLDLLPFCELIFVEQIVFPNKHYAQSLSNSIRASMITKHLLLLLNFLQQRSNQQLSTNRQVAKFNLLWITANWALPVGTRSRSKLALKWAHIAHSHQPHSSVHIVLLQSMNERC